MNTAVRRLLHYALLCLALLLQACGGGGGGGGGSGTPSTPSANVAPQASFAIDPAQGSAPLLVRFDAAASVDSDGSIVAYDWDFGDGSDGSGALSEHLYEQPGVYTVTLTVRDDDGASGNASDNVTVTESFSLSGSIRILASSAIDGDVNDRNAAATENNSFDSAQSITNPSTLGGYVNLPGTGDDGALRDSGDPADVYAVSLLGNEVLVLAVADAEADLDLNLYDAQRQLVDSSLNPGNQSEFLEVAVAGDYFIEVWPFSGASNYVLSVGQGQAPATESLRLSQDFVPGDILLRQRERKSLPVLRGLEMRHAGARGLRLMRLRERGEALNALLPGRAEAGPAAAHVPPALREKLDTLLAVKALRKRRDVRGADLNLRRYASRLPNDPFYRNQWHFAGINLPQAWDISTGSAEVIVAVVDTGVLLDHPDLRDRLVPGYDFISDSARAADGDGPDPDPNDPGDGDPGVPSSFHGTHVAGTVAASSDNGIGVAGVAWQARIMPLRVLGVGGGPSFDIIQAILYAAGEENASGTLPAEAADVINLSLGGGSFSRSELDAVQAARAKGLIVVAAAGNESSSAPFYPASYDGVVSVSATTITKSLAFYSNRGATVDLAAPGGSNQTDIDGDGFGDGVASTLGDDSSGPVRFGYGFLSGTSMAAPHVAGVIALMKAVHADLGPTEFDQALSAGLLTDDLGSAGRDDLYGHGLLNAQKALTAALQMSNGGAELPPLASTTPGTLSFGAFGSELEFDVVSVGGDGLQVLDVAASEAWLTVRPLQVDSNGIGRYRASVLRDGLGDGVYSASIDVQTSANAPRLSVLMQVTSLDVDADAGFHYVLLINASSDEVLDQQQGAASDGEYRFRFDSVAPGTYWIIAGSDSDNDFLLCDSGESCGGYRTLDTPQLIQVDASMDGLDFTTGFLVNISDTAATPLSEAARSSARLLRRVR